MKYCTLIILLVLVIHPAKAQSPTLSNILSNVGLDQKLNNQIPLDLTFRNERGDTVPLSAYIGGNKPAVISLVYYECPELCTEILNGMVMAFRQIPFQLGKDYTVITVSINPRETPALAAEKKHAYLHSYPQPEAVNGWHFMVGDSIQIKQLADAVGYRFEFDKETGQYAHPSGIIIVTPNGRVARYLYGVEYPDKDLRFALSEASDNRIGSPVDKILLLCYHYDPATGKYGLAVMNILRIGGILTLCILGVIIFILIRRDRHKAILTPAEHRQ
jgi:protein SCO1/2